MNEGAWRSWGEDAPPELLQEFNREMRRALEERDLDDTTDFELEVGGQTFLMDGILLRRVKPCRR